MNKRAALLSEADDINKQQCPGHFPKEECKRQLLPVKDALDILGGKWKLPIIVSLSFGKKRFKQIQREVEGITPRMLSKELKDLEINELVERRAYDTAPITVEYRLTSYGRSLHKVIFELRNWGMKHRKRMARK